MNTTTLIPNWLANSDLIVVAITDMKGNYTYVNKHFQERFSWLSDDLIGLPSALTIHPDDMEICLKAVQECIKYPGKSVRVEIRKPQNKPERYQWTAWEFTLLQDINSVHIGILCLGKDITEVKNLTKKIAEKDNLIFNMTYAQCHDIRGPVASMKGLLELIDFSISEDIQMVGKYCSYLKEALNKLDNSIKKIVTMGEDLKTS